ncbi:MAG TPA: hypothetical protein PLH27_05305 [bacterium]|nr:hypothetical protein [bacterium]HMW36571.1 hypothetical protein [bacterium]HMY35192.1 hypothetical protein [bacterium]HMZ03928.1 hypothetical protein [bacterium]HNB08387.1 hypothetical protein [bacterium]
MHDTDPLYRSLQIPLTRLRREENRLYFQTNALRGAAFLLLLALLTASIEVLSDPDVLGRWVLAMSALMIACVIIAFYIVSPILRLFGVVAASSDFVLAQQIGQRFPEIKDRLLNALQLFGELREGNEKVSEPMIIAAIQTIHTTLEKYDIISVADRTVLRKTWRYTSVVVIAASIVFLFFNRPLTDAFARLADPGKKPMEVIPYRWVIVPGTTDILQGQNRKISVEIIPLTSDAAMPDAVQLLTQLSGVEQVTETLMKKDTARFYSLELQNLRQETTYWFKFSYVENSRKRAAISEKNTLHVMRRPSVKRLQIEIESPTYARIEHRILEANSGDIQALKGSRVRVTMEATKSLQEARIVFSDSTSIPLKTSVFNYEKAEGSFKVMKSGTYHFVMTDKEGTPSADPVEYRIDVQDDLYPLVQLNIPEKDGDITEAMLQKIVADVQDDFGVSRIVLNYKLMHTRGVLPIPETYTTEDLSFLIRSDQSEFDVAYNWEFSKLLLQPEDVIGFYLEVWDNDAVSGPKKTKSVERRLRFPSMEEIFAETNQKQDQQIQAAEEIAKESEEIKKSLEEVHREMLKDKKPEWKDKEKIKQLVEKQEELQKKAESIQKSLEEMTDKLKEQNLLTPETVQKYQELQKLLSEINSKEMQELMQKMQKAMENNFDPNQMRDALKNFKMDQEAFKKNVDRTVELLKRIKAEQMFDQLRRTAEDLEKQQKDLDRMTSNLKNDNERTAAIKEQERIRKNTDDLKKKSDELQKLVKELNNNQSNQKLNTAQDQLQQNNIQNRMQQSQQAMSDKQEGTKEEKENREDIHKSLDSLSRSMADAQKEHRANQDEAIKRAMQKIVVDMLVISQNQEALISETSPLNFASVRFREVTQDQSDILSNMGIVTENLLELSNKTFFVNTPLGKTVGQAMGQMQTAVKAMEERNTPQAVNSQTAAMVSVNEAIKLLLLSMDKMNNGQSGTGMEELMEQMREAAGKQRRINQGMPSLMEGQDNNPGGLSQEQQAQLGRMMAEQQALKQSMEAMKDQAGAQQGLKGQLGNLAKEMEEVIKDMQSNQVNRKTIERQQKILQRMLDASTSMQEKDMSEKRKGETGKNYDAVSPRALPENLTDRRNFLRQELLRQMKQGYAKDYQELIKRYFDELGEKTGLPKND